MVESIKSFDTGSSALARLLGKSLQTDQNASSLPILNSLLPNSAFLEEACATGLAITRVEESGPVEFLNLATFLISNNFPGETGGEYIYKWLQTHGSTTVLKTIASTKGPTGEALLENLFRLAIEAEDIPTVKLLIEAGVNPNGHMCRHKRIPDHMNPLQYACMRGNSELALELINAGSSIDQPGNGWKSSALVLAIIGENLKDNKDFWEYPMEDILTEDNEDFEEATNSLFIRLICGLIDAGAAVNLTVNQSCPTLPKWAGDKSLYLDNALASIMQDGHSPLTAASKYRNKELVDLFLQQGADVNFLTERDTSALCECLYSWEQMKLDIYVEDTHPSAFSERQPIFRGCESLSKVIGVARSLLAAGADVDADLFWRPEEDDDDDDVHIHTKEDSCYLTTLDLSVLTESVELVNMMLCAGACTVTGRSLEQAFRMGSFELANTLLDIGAPLSSIAARSAIRQDDSGKYIVTLLRKRSDVTTQKTILFEAIRLGNNHVVEYVFRYGTSNGQNPIHDLHGIGPAIGDYCDDGHIDTLRLIIDKCSKYNVSISSHFGECVLLAVRNGWDDIVDILLSAGADVNDVFLGETALRVAIEKKNQKTILKLIKANSLLSTEITDDDDRGITSSCFYHHKVCGDPLIMAIEWGDNFVVEKLLNAGASIDALGSVAGLRRFSACECITPLTAAIMRKNLNLVDSLISRGAAVNNPPNSADTSMTPLAAAVRIQHSELMESLLQRGANPYDSLALQEATSDIRLLQVLVTALHRWNKPPDDKIIGDGALVKAMQKQDQEMILALLDSPLRDIKSFDIVSCALRKALWYDSTPNFEIVHMVLSRGVDPNIVWRFKNGSGDTASTYIRSALCVVIAWKSPGKVKVLLEAGGKANKNLTCGMYDSPMQFAASLRRQDIVRILLEDGSDPNAVALPQANKRKAGDEPERDNGTPLQIAVSNRDTGMIRLLLQYNGNPNAIFGNMPHTPLQIASRDGSKEIVELLLEHGAKVNAPPAKEFGATALQFAAMKGLLGIAHLLLEYEADVNAPPAEVEGRTALEGAAEHGRIDMVQLLLNAGANIFQDGEAQYENAIRRASENGHHAVRRLLESYHG